VPPGTAGTVLGVEHYIVHAAALEVVSRGKTSLACADHGNVDPGTFHSTMIVAEDNAALVLAQGDRRTESGVAQQGRVHSRHRDSAAISHHYDVGNDFYALVLGPSMVYSCAVRPECSYDTERPLSGSHVAADLAEAQEAKLVLVCRKLGLKPGMRVLDVGCGWGSFALHAAGTYGTTVVGVTLSKEQAILARKRAADAGLTEQVDIRVQDYRDVRDGPFDAISSIGMSEHVGRKQTSAYAAALFGLLRPGGRLLNHAISWNTGPTKPDPGSFIPR
jgi:cyclopropane-fatty-acyl-phospholipid synthase